MKASKSIRRTTAWGLTYAIALSTVLFFCVACTRNDDMNVGDTTDGTSAITTPAGTSGTPGTGSGPMDPDAGTVNPNGDAGDPPAGTDNAPKGKGFGPRYMH